MDLRETREFVKEGVEELLKVEAAFERLQRQEAELRAQLAQREEALRDQQRVQADLEQLLAASSERVEQLKTELQRRRPRPAAPAPAPIQEEDPADMSYGSRMRSLRDLILPGSSGSRAEERRTGHHIWELQSNARKHSFSISHARHQVFHQQSSN